MTAFEPIGDVEAIVLHHTATPADRDYRMADVRRDHLARGFSGPGYHGIVCRDGALEVGRPLWAKGAHVWKANTGKVGIAMAGGADAAGEPELNFTGTQFATLRRVVEALKLFFPDAAVVAHADVSLRPTACCAFDVEAWWTEAAIIPARGANHPQRPYYADPNGRCATA